MISLFTNTLFLNIIRYQTFIHTQQTDRYTHHAYTILVSNIFIIVMMEREKKEKNDFSASLAISIPLLFYSSYSSSLTFFLFPQTRARRHTHTQILNVYTYIVIPRAC